MASTLKDREIVSQVCTVFGACTKMQICFEFYQCRTSMNYTGSKDCQTWIIKADIWLRLGKDRLTSHSYFIPGQYCIIGVKGKAKHFKLWVCIFGEHCYSVVSEIFGKNFVCMLWFVVRCLVVLLQSSTILCAGLVNSISCIVVAVWRPCFMQVLLTVCHVLLLLSSTMLRAGLVNSMSCSVVAVFDHASCWSCLQYVM